MAIEKVIIQNFKKFKNPFEVKFNENINLLVGDNESGKSTILEAIHVALTGTDNDGNIEAVKKKYKEYEEIQCIHICVDEVVDTGDLKLSDKDFNYNTLEPKILKENGREAMNNIFGTNYNTDDEMHKYMHAHKTDCAIAIFESATKIKYPEYIMRAIKNE